MVIPTFHQPGANKPIDVQRLTSSSAPFVILTHGVRWHVGVPYGYPYLSSTRGKRACWRAEANIVFCTFCHPDLWSQVVGGDNLWSSIPFIHRGEWVRRYQDDVGRLILTILKIFAGFYSRRPETFKPDDAQDSSLLGGGRLSSMAWGSVVVVQLYHFQDIEVCWRFWCLFFSFWMAGSAGGDIDRPNNVPLERN